MFLPPSPVSLKTLTHFSSLCGDKIIEMQQEYYQCNMTISGMSGFDGLVATGTFFDYPIDLSGSTMVIGRKVSHVLAAFSALLFMGYPVMMHGAPETINELELIFSTLPGTLEQAQKKLQARLSLMSPSDLDDRYDMHNALESSIRLYLDKFPTVNPAMLDARTSFFIWLSEFFTAKDSKSTGIVRLSSLHAAKGNEADEVYLLNPRMSPLKERIALGGFEEYEEMCVAYIARSRGRKKHINLPDLENTTRESILELFKNPNITDDVANADEAPGTSQGTDATTDANDVSDAETDDALATLNLNEIPANVQELEKTVRALLFKVHPDHNLNSTAAKEKTQAVLNARAVIKTALAMRS